VSEVYDIEGIAQVLTQEEGYRRYSYEDHLGYTTVGIGRCLEEGVGYGIDEEEAQWLLKRDIQRVWDNCSGQISFWPNVSSNIKETVVMLVFQMGLGGYLKFKKHIAAIEAQDFELAAAELLDSRFARQTPERAKRMASRIAAG
jgi:lysozyme